METKMRDKLEIYIEYRENENERKMKFKGLGKWKSIENEV